MLTSYLQLSGAGLNSLPPAVTFPTSPSDRCFGLRSVPDKLLKIHQQEARAAAPWPEKGHCYPSTVNTCPLSSSPVLSTLSHLTQAPHAQRVSKGTEAKKGSKTLCIRPESSAQMRQSLTLRLGTSPFPSVPLGNEWVGPNSLPGPCKRSSLSLRNE